jgi:hypothetical protein
MGEGGVSRCGERERQPVRNNRCLLSIGSRDAGAPGQDAMPSPLPSTDVEHHRLLHCERPGETLGDRAGDPRGEECAASRDQGTRFKLPPARARREFRTTRVCRHDKRALSSCPSRRATLHRELAHARASWLERAPASLLGTRDPDRRGFHISYVHPAWRGPGARSTSTDLRGAIGRARWGRRRRRSCGSTRRR